MLSVSPAGCTWRVSQRHPRLSVQKQGELQYNWGVVHVFLCQVLDCTTICAEVPERTGAKTKCRSPHSLSRKGTEAFLF